MEKRKKRCVEDVTHRFCGAVARCCLRSAGGLFTQTECFCICLWLGPAEVAKPVASPSAGGVLHPLEDAVDRFTHLDTVEKAWWALLSGVRGVRRDIVGFLLAGVGVAWRRRGVVRLSDVRGPHVHGQVFSGRGGGVVTPVAGPPEEGDDGECHQEPSHDGTSFPRMGVAWSLLPQWHRAMWGSLRCMIFPYRDENLVNRSDCMKNVHLWRLEHVLTVLSRWV